MSDPRLAALRQRRLQATGKKGIRMATKYKILFQDENGWSEGYPDIEATSAKDAIRKTLNEKAKQDGTFVAIPARSWQPVNVKIEQALKFS